MAHTQPYSIDRKATSEKRRQNDLSMTARFFRILLVGSFYFKLRQCQHPTDQQLEKLNQLIPIVTRVSALWVPAFIARFLWKHLDVCTMLAKLKAGDITASHAVNLVIHTVPRIGHYEGMDRDIGKLLADGIDQ